MYCTETVVSSSSSSESWRLCGMVSASCRCLDPDVPSPDAPMRQSPLLLFPLSVAFPGKRHSFVILFVLLDHVLGLDILPLALHSRLVSASSAYFQSGTYATVLGIPKLVGHAVPATVDTHTLSVRCPNHAKSILSRESSCRAQLTSRKRRQRQRLHRRRRSFVEGECYRGVSESLG